MAELIVGKVYKVYCDGECVNTIKLTNVDIPSHTVIGISLESKLETRFNYYINNLIEVK